MKKLILILCIIPLMGCAQWQTNWDKLNPYFKQAFGDAVRSLEGMAIQNIPAAIMQLRKQWLPPGKVYDDLAAGVIHSYLAAHPNTNADVKKVLESLATMLQTTP